MLTAVKVISSGLIIAVAVCAGAGPAAAQQGAEQTTAAEFLFEEGRRLMDAGNYPEACEKFAASHDAEPSVGALLNLGECQTRLGRTASAWTSFRQAAALARRGGDQRRSRFAEERAEELEDKLAYVVIEVAGEHHVDGMTVFRNETEVPASLWNQRVPVDPGEYTVTAEAPGHRRWSTQISIAARSDGGGEVTRVAVPALPPDESASPPGAAAVETGPPSELPPARDTGGGLGTGRTVAIAAGVVGLVGLGAGVTFALQSQSKNDQAYDDGHCDAMNTCDERGVALIDDARSAARNAYIFYGVGAAAVAAGAVLWFTSSPGAGADAHARGPSLRPTLAPGVAGVSLSGRF